MQVTDCAASVDGDAPTTHVGEGGSTPTAALQVRMFNERPDCGILLRGADREAAEERISRCHYLKKVHSGKSHFVGFGPAILVWSIPANKNVAGALFLERLHEGGVLESCVVWELSRLWAPDGHEPNLLTRTIKAGVALLKRIERPDALISYADPNVGHHGGIYKAASWLYAGTTEDTRTIVGPDGRRMGRRSFHSGAARGKTKAEVEAMGFRFEYGEGKHRYVKLLTKRSKQLYLLRKK